MAHRTQENSVLILYQVIIKGSIKDSGEHLDGREAQGKTLRRGSELLGSLLPQNHVLTSLGALESRVLGIFMKASSCRYDQLLTSFVAPFPL